MAENLLIVTTGIVTAILSAAILGSFQRRLAKIYEIRPTRSRTRATRQ